MLIKYFNIVINNSFKEDSRLGIWPNPNPHFKHNFLL